MATVSIEEVSSFTASQPNTIITYAANKAPRVPYSSPEDGLDIIVSPLDFPHVQQIQRPPLIPNTCSVAPVCRDEILMFAVIAMLAVALVLVLLLSWLIIARKF